MAETTITGLPNATTPLDGTERVPMDQDGKTVDATTQAIANLAGAAITAAVDALTPADIGAATAAQGGLADSAVQPGDLAAVATSGAYGDLSGTPTVPSLSDATPQAPGIAAAGTASSAARGDHVHPLPGVVSTSAAGLQPASGYGTISYAAQVTLDFATLNGRINTISLAGALELLSSNLANGREVRLRLVCDGTQRALTFPTDWKFVGSKPANIAASKVAILSLAAFGATNADVVAAYAVQS